MGRPLKIAKVAGTTADVDTGFNNPEGSSNTYGVVGGVTSLSGQQTLVRVALPKAGAGQITTTAGNTDVFGSVTDFADVSVGSHIQVNGVDIGFVDSITSVNILPITSTVATGSFIVTSGNAQTFTANQPVWFDANIGGLALNTTYYFLSAANATHFTVSTGPGNGKFPVTSETATSNCDQVALVLTANSPVTNSRVQNFTYANDAAGYIVRQKGKRKYLVADATTIQDEDIKAGTAYRIVSASGTNWALFGADATATAGDIFTATVNGNSVTVDDGTVNQVGVCQTINAANAAITTNRMNIVATLPSTSNVFIDSLTNYFATDFTDNGTDENSGTKYVGSFNGAVAANSALGFPNGVVDIAST